MRGEKLGWQPPSADNVDRTPTRRDETAQRVCLKIGSIVMELKKEFVRKKCRRVLHDATSQAKFINLSTKYTES